jgi:predicted RNA-binding protein associated with RNAse of E/G family
MDITVIKQDPDGREVWRYPGRLLQRYPDRIVVEAYFNREDMALGDLVLEKGDRFVETYFMRRWYNAYEIYAQRNGNLKGWYCNISYPALYQPGWIAYRDLALDLIVFPNGRQVVLDWDEFHALDLKPETRALALEALSELQDKFTRRLK